MKQKTKFKKSKIEEWSQKEAGKWFKKIEGDKGKGESYNIDWKVKWDFKDTGFNSGNTTQKAVSGFANTSGGIIVFGFDNKGNLKGVDEEKDIENKFQRKLKKKISPYPPLFTLKYYDYKKRKVLVMFIQESKIPLQCDNGIYYCRQQTEFLPMSHEMLEKKFRECFEEEKYLSLVRNELKDLIDYIREKSENSDRNEIVSYKVSEGCKIFFKSGENLYNFYRENNILQDYYKLSKTLRLWCIDEGDVPKKPNHFSNLKTEVEKFYEKIQKYGKNSN